MFIHSVTNLAINKVFSANRLLNSPIGITTHRYNREGWAIVLKVKGKTIYTVGDEIVLSDSLHPVILPKGCSYSWKCIEPGECIIIEFEAENTETTFASFEINDNSLLVNNFSKIEKSLSTKKMCHRLECNYYLYEILLFLLKSLKQEHPHSKKYFALKPAIKYITENYSDSRITDELLSELCGMSNVYFRKIFASVYGTSPIKYLHNLRIEKAKAILRSDFETIEQVALSVGYNSIFHFSKMFKQYTGTSPSEYANNSSPYHNNDYRISKR